MTQANWPADLTVGGHSEPDDTQPMSAAEFRMVCEAIGLNQDDAAEWLRVDPRTVRRWQQGQSPVPDGVRQQLEDREQDVFEWAQRLAVELQDAADLVISVPRDGDPPFTAAFWRAVAYQASRMVDGVHVRYTD